MPISLVQTFTLKPHAAAESQTLSIRGEIGPTPGGVRVRYVLAGDLNHVRVPDPQSPRFADDLWRHTCFEMFVAQAGEAPYHEFNFSPSGEWAVYAFARYRERAPFDAESAFGKSGPHITMRWSAEQLELEAVVCLDRLALHAPLAFGLSAVIEDNAGRLSYWALTHPLEKPDFHHPDAFVLELDEVRN